MWSRLRSVLILAASGSSLRPADGVVLAALIFLFVYAAYASISGYALANPGIAPYIDPEWLRVAFLLTTRLSLPGALLFLIAGLLARRYWPESRALAHLAMQGAVLSVVFASYSDGHYTSLLGATSLFGVTVGGLLLFDARVVRTGLASFLVLVVATTVAEQLGYLRYAPLFAASPFEGGHLARSWLVGRGGWSFIVLIGIAFFLVAVTQRLRRATSLIRRYVPQQLAEQILAGEHTGFARPSRKRVTVFFSDVAGFTNAADRMEPEDLAALLNEYLAEMAAIAEGFDATLNQFVGDGIMIFFGAPQATSDRDHALRAVRMAQAMQRRVGELGESWRAAGLEDGLRVRIGINSGVASVGDFGSGGRMTYSAIGNQTNLAARIQTHCDPGKILISHTTWALVRDEIPCKERGELEAKGLHYRVSVYEVLEEG